ncbi:hypothetical protein LCGC14_3099610, partial [marine sediment metagenome]
RKDPHVSTGSATLSDYKGSGYDRGHIIPAADMKWSPDAMSASFFMSNMSPQDPSFNRGIWKKLEEQVREWAVGNREIYVVTGPVLTEFPHSINCTFFRTAGNTSCSASSGIGQSGMV